jgi:plastocyanin
MQERCYSGRVGEAGAVHPVMRRLLPLALALAAVVAVPATAGAAKLPKDVTRTTYRYPIDLRPGTNIIKIRFGVPHPRGPGFMVRFAPNLTRRDGSIPPTDKIHLHHGVWLKLGSGPATPGYPAEIISAVGEEKTIASLPRPYGYPVNPGDTWLLNDMIHDLTNRGMRLYVTWTVDYVPANTPLGRTLKPVHTLWNDVERGKTYPVFDVLKGSGTRGRFTYPDQDPNAYAGRQGERPNETTITRAGTLVSCFGHVHPGGLYTDLRLARGGRSKLLFRSEAKYFGGRPPVSWDLAMTRTPADWRVRVQPGDVLSVHGTYDTKLGSWYEEMGIMPCAFAADDSSGADPFASKIETRGKITHGHLAENNHWGGGKTGIADPTTLPNGSAPGNEVDIGNFKYRYGDLSGVGSTRNPPTVAVGQSLEFINQDAGPAQSFDRQIFHTVTACKAPCNRSTGIGYPLPNGSPLFDSGQLGFGQVGFTAAANRNTWKTPTNLPPGTYTYLCRGHPFMRGAFRVVPVKT